MSPPPPGGPLPAGPSPVGPSPVAGLPPPPPVRMESGGRIGYEKGGDINIDKAQFEKFLKLVQAEARDPETQKAVASVILNRLTVGGGEFGDTLEEVMLKSGAFEPIGNIIKENRGKMNWNALEAPSEITRANITKWFNEGSKDSTDGALFFINKQLTDERETTHPIFENWDESMRLPDGTKRIGKMLFSNRFEVNDKIDRVEAARAAGEPTITVAGVVTPQPSVEITSPSFPPPFIDPDKMPDLMAQSLAAVKAPEGLKSEPVVDSDFNITPVDAVLGEPIDPLLVDDGTIPDSGFGVPPGLVEAAGTAQGLPTTSWLEGYKRLISPGIGKGEDFGRLTPVADNLTAEARALIENAGVDPTIPSTTAGVTTGEPQFSPTGQLISGWSGPKTGQDVRTYTAPFTSAIAAYEPLPDDPGFNVMDPTTKREGLSPYNMAGMLKEARDQVGREERQVAEADIIQGAEIDPMNLMPPRGQVVPSQEARNVLALQNRILAATPAVSADQFALEPPVAGPFSYMANTVGVDNEALLAGNGGTPGEFEGVGPRVEAPDAIPNVVAENVSSGVRTRSNLPKPSSDGFSAVDNLRKFGHLIPSDDEILANQLAEASGMLTQQEKAPITQAEIFAKAGHLPSQKAAYGSLTDVDERFISRLAGLPADGGQMTYTDAVEAALGGMNTGTAGLPPPSAENQYLLDLEESMANAKGMGMLMAGLGVMGEAAKPGATLGSALPGAAAGVKTYMESSKDIRKTALEREKMRRLANYQQQNLESKPYQAMRANMIDAYSRHPQLREQYGTIVAGKWQPNAEFENLVIQKARTSSSSDQLREELTYAKIRDFWGKGSSSPGKKWERARRKILEREGMEPDAIRAQIAREREGQFNKWLQGIRKQRGIGVVPTAGGNPLEQFVG